MSMEVFIGIITAINVAFTVGWNFYKDKKRLPPTEIKDLKDSIEKLSKSIDGLWNPLGIINQNLVRTADELDRTASNLAELSLQAYNIANKY